VSVDIESFYERYGPMVLRRCRALLRNDAKAQDALQDVFVALLRHQERLQDQAPSALLLRVATNVCLNRLRTERRRPEDADDERLQQIAAGSDDGDGRTLARDLLAKLFRADDPLAASTQTIAVMHLIDGSTGTSARSRRPMALSWRRWSSQPIAPTPWRRSPCSRMSLATAASKSCTSTVAFWGVRPSTHSTPASDPPG
jgi:RNA polymerase sigma factor (sigma-70 family)